MLTNGYILLQINENGENCFILYFINYLFEITVLTCKKMKSDRISYFVHDFLKKHSFVWYYYIELSENATSRNSIIRHFHYKQIQLNMVFYELNIWTHSRAYHDTIQKNVEMWEYAKRDVFRYEIDWDLVFAQTCKRAVF